jgi:hypothetical protein
LSKADKNRGPITATPRRDLNEKPGQIRFDDRGNAVFEWNDTSLVAEGDSGNRRRLRALAHPGLSLMDEAPAPEAPLARNDRGLKLGYNPYQSGVLPDKSVKKKRDMRELSKWIELKKKINQTEEK